MSTNIAMKAIMHDHLEEVSKDFYAGGFVVIMEAMEAMLKERYGPDFRAAPIRSPGTWCRTTRFLPCWPWSP